MELLPTRRTKVADGLHVMLSNHFFYTDFGVRDRDMASNYGRRYICTGTPGTGFIEHDTDSRSYNDYVRGYLKKQRHSYWRMALGLEPSFDAEVHRVRHALDKEQEPLRRRILDAYLNALQVAALEERIERIERGIKDKIGHKHHNKYYISVLNHYKHKAQRLGDDMRSVQIDVSDLCSAEQYKAWLNLVDAFIKVVSCRRVWHLNENTRHKYEQVFFDLGIFDFIHSSTFIPIMSTSAGVDYYILPTHIIAARSSVDFELLPIGRTTIVCQEMAIQETVETLSSRIGDAASMLRMPSTDQTWYFNHVRPIMHFVGAYDELKALQ